MTPEEMDKVFEAHCAAEAAKDVEAILGTLTDDAEHDLVGAPDGVLTNRDLITGRYRTLFDSLEGDSMETLRRYHGADFFVDESRYVGRVVGDFLGIPGHNRTVDYRILHVCEFRDGKISRENVWLDVATVMQQLAAP